LMTGGFTTVTFELVRPKTDFNVAASALIFDRSGLRVATVDRADRVILKDITIARDLGKEVEIGSGLTAEDRVIQSPPDGLQNGDLVRVAGEAGSNVQANAAVR
jgi:membrane fusion protein, multidrug efflux system